MLAIVYTIACEILLLYTIVLIWNVAWIPSLSEGNRSWGAIRRKSRGVKAMAAVCLNRYNWHDWIWATHMPNTTFLTTYKLPWAIVNHNFTMRNCITTRLYHLWDQLVLTRQDISLPYNLHWVQDCSLFENLVQLEVVINN